MCEEKITPLDEYRYVAREIFQRELDIIEKESEKLIEETCPYERNNIYEKINGRLEYAKGKYLETVLGKSKGIKMEDRCIHEYNGGVSGLGGNRLFTCKKCGKVDMDD